MGKFYKFILFLFFLYSVLFPFDELNINSFDRTVINLKISQGNDKSFVLILNPNLDYECWENFIKNISSSFCFYNIRKFENNFDRTNRKLKNQEYDYSISVLIKDLDAILSSLENKYSVKKNNVILIGFETSNNTILKYASSSNVKAIILISPTKDDRVIESIKNYRDKIMIISQVSNRDTNNVALDYMTYLSRNKNVEMKFSYNVYNKSQDILKDEGIIRSIANWVSNV